MNFPAHLARLAQDMPDKEAVAWPGGRHHYRELHEWINRTANGLRTLGVGPGDRVLIQIGNRVEFLYAYFGTMQIGAITVPVNPLYTPREVGLLAADCEPVVVILEQAAAGNTEAVRQAAPTVRQVFLLDAEHGAADFVTFLCSQSGRYGEIRLDPDAVTEIIYTSGTTGRPKGAMLTQRGLWLNAVEYGQVHHCTGADRALIVAPLFHSGAQTNCMNNMLVVGGASFLLPRFVPEVVLATMADEAITYFFGPPTMYTMLLNTPFHERQRLQLRIAFSGAAPMPAEVHKRWEEVFGFPVLEGYGLSEASPVVTQTREGGVRKLGAVGPALPSVTVQILNELGQECAPGVVGEVAVGGPCVMKGYWRNPEATAAALDGQGRLRTGDLGYLDTDGFLYIVDRKKDMINRGGLKIYPREVEEVLYTCPEVLEAAVIGVPHPVLGEDIQAYITLRDPQNTPSTEAIIRHCRERLAPYKVPRGVEVLARMPKTVSGKILKTDLRQAVP